MLRRVNPKVLCGAVIVLILSVGILASAQSSVGSAGDAISVGEMQMGKPFMMSTDGPDTFSCSGLMRYILRTIGVDSDAPWVPEEYLSKYSPVSLDNLQPGDIVIMPGWATMYAGNGMLLNANEVLGKVTLTPLSDAGKPLGAVRPPYGEGSQPPADPAAVTTTNAVDPITNPVVDPVAADVVDPAVNDVVDPVVSDVVDPLATGVVDPLLVGDAAQPSDTLTQYQ